MKIESHIKVGAGRCIFKEDALDCIGKELSYYGNRIFIIGGKNALKETLDKIESSLERSGLSYDVYYFSGDCTVRKIEDICIKAAEFKAKVILGVGGGKCIDTSKAVAGKLGIRVATVPTSAATCAAWASVSIIYEEDGTPAGNILNDFENIAVFIDTDILKKCPQRYLAAGMADAMAKYYEMYPGALKEYKKVEEDKYAEQDTPLLIAFEMSKATRDILKNRGIHAYKNNHQHILTNTLEDVIFTNIVTTGVISGFSSGSKQLALAHTFQDVIKTHFKSVGHEALHGELVGTGILIQMAYNGFDKDEIDSMRKWLSGIGIPISLREYGIEYTRDNLLLIKNSLKSGFWFKCSDSMIEVLNAAFEEVL